MSTTHQIIGQLTETTTAFLAAPGDPTTAATTAADTGGGLSGTTAAVSSRGLTDWLKDNAVPIILLIIGLGVAMAARKGETSKVVTVGALTLISLAFIAIALDASTGISIGRWIVNLFFKSAG